VESLLKNLNKAELIERLQQAAIHNQSLTSANQTLTHRVGHLEQHTHQLEEHTQYLEQAKDQLEDQSGRLAGQLQWLSHQLAQLKRLMYDAKRERFICSPNQMSLPFEAEQAPKPTTTTEQISYQRKKQNRENHPGRHALPAHLPVEEVIIEPDNKPNDAVKIGEAITDELEYKPAELYIKRYIRPKYSLGKEEGVLIAELPTRPIDKAIAGPGLLAQITVDKFVDHLPIYRQIERWKRWDVKLSASTINSWQEKVCKLLEPLYETLRHHVLSEGYLQVDETPLRVLDKNKKGKTHQGYHWVYHSPIRKAVLFDYRRGRSREGPKEMLKDFSGYLQTDGYAAYDWFKTNKAITMLSCMAHTRRYFEQALDNDKARAEYVLTHIQQLYAIERQAKEKGLSLQQRHELRLDKSLPILNQLGKYIATEYKKVLPKSAIGKAFSYAVARWDNLLNYLGDGYLEIDNNGVENAIRPNALGRKNYLFAGSHQGAYRAAMFYTFFGTCKLNGVNPYSWMKYVLETIPDHKANKLYLLLPYNCKGE